MSLLSWNIRLKQINHTKSHEPPLPMLQMQSNQAAVVNSSSILRWQCASCQQEAWKLKTFKSRFKNAFGWELMGIKLNLCISNYPKNLLRKISLTAVTQNILHYYSHLHTWLSVDRYSAIPMEASLPLGLLVELRSSAALVLPQHLGLTDTARLLALWTRAIATALSAETHPHHST